MPDITSTLRRKFIKELRRRSAEANGLQVIHVEALAKLASRHHLTINQCVSIAQTVNIKVHGSLNKTASEPPKPKPLLSDHVKWGIINAVIYKFVYEPQPGDDKDTFFVVTTYGQLRREREALKQWMREAGVILPEKKK